MASSSFSYISMFIFAILLMGYLCASCNGQKATFRCRDGSPCSFDTKPKEVGDYDFSGMYLREKAQENTPGSRKLGAVVKSTETIHMSKGEVLHLVTYKSRKDDSRHKMDVITTTPTAERFYTREL